MDKVAENKLKIKIPKLNFLGIFENAGKMTLAPIQPEAKFIKILDRISDKILSTSLV